jgi:hypothetical protein
VPDVCIIHAIAMALEFTAELDHRLDEVDCLLIDAEHKIDLRVHEPSG